MHQVICPLAAHVSYPNVSSRLRKALAESEHEIARLKATPQACQLPASGLNAAAPPSPPPRSPMDPFAPDDGSERSMDLASPLQPTLTLRPSSVPVFIPLPASRPATPPRATPRSPTARSSSSRSSSPPLRAHRPSGPGLSHTTTLPPISTCGAGRTRLESISGTSMGRKLRRVT